MAKAPKGSQWKTLDTDLNRISQVENAADYIGRPMVGPGIALAFMVIAGLCAAVFFGATPINFVIVFYIIVSSIDPNVHSRRIFY